MSYDFISGFLLGVSVSSLVFVYMIHIDRNEQLNKLNKKQNICLDCTDKEIQNVINKVT